MLASTPVRVAIVVAALVGLTAGYRWWNSPERHINRMLSDVASALSHDGAETDLRALATVASLQNHRHPDVTIDLGRGSLLRGRFFDSEIRLTGDMGTTRVTVQVTTRDAGGDEVAAAHVVSIELVRTEGRWQIANARVLPEDTPL